jgi:hypothetical protein
MRKAILLMILAVVSSNAAAEWVEVVKAGDDDYYADPSTILKSGNMVKMWELRNSNWSDEFKNLMKGLEATFPDYRKTALSVKMQIEFDCKEQQTRTLFVYNYTGNMGLGEIIPSTIDTDKWEPIVPDSVAEALWKYACGKE